MDPGMRMFMGIFVVLFVIAFVTIIAGMIFSFVTTGFVFKGVFDLARAKQRELERQKAAAVPTKCDQCGASWEPGANNPSEPPKCAYCGAILKGNSSAD